MKKQQNRLLYIGEMAEELAKMARSEGTCELAYILEMAALEAKALKGDSRDGERG